MAIDQAAVREQRASESAAAGMQPLLLDSHARSACVLVRMVIHNALLRSFGSLGCRVCAYGRLAVQRNDTGNDGLVGCRC